MKKQLMNKVQGDLKIQSTYIRICINFLIANGGWLILGVKVTALVAVFSISVYMFGFTKEERSSLFKK